MYFILKRLAFYVLSILFLISVVPPMPAYADLASGNAAGSVSVKNQYLYELGGQYNDRPLTLVDGQYGLPALDEHSWQVVTALDPLKMYMVQPPSLIMDHSGSVTTGGTAQYVMDTNPLRQGLIFQNVSSGDLWINEMGGVASAAQPSFKVVSGATWTSPDNYQPTGKLSVFGATTAQQFTVREW